MHAFSHTHRRPLHSKELVYAEQVDIRSHHRSSNIAFLPKAPVQMASEQQAIGHVLLAAVCIKSFIEAPSTSKCPSKTAPQIPITSNCDATYHVLSSSPSPLQSKPPTLSLLRWNTSTRWIWRGIHIKAYHIETSSVYKRLFVYSYFPTVRPRFLEIQRL